MQELTAIKDAVRPHQILFVADSMTGQDAVNQAIGFDGKLDLSGIILTKLDGDARGGAALIDPRDGRQADPVFRHRRKTRRSRTVLPGPAGIENSRHGRRAFADRQSPTKCRAEGSRSAFNRLFRNSNSRWRNFRCNCSKSRRMGSMGELAGNDSRRQEAGFPGGCRRKPRKS